MMNRKRNYWPLPPQCGWSDRSFQLFRDIVRLVRDTGMRNGRELYRMRIENLDWAKRNIFVPDSKTPEGRRTIPMSERVFEILRARCGTKTSGWVFPSRRKAAKVRSPWLDCKSLSGGTKESGPSGKTGPLLRASRFWHLDRCSRTGNLKAVMKVMGHKDVKTAMKYQHPEIDIVRAALNQGGVATQLGG